MGIFRILHQSYCLNESSEVSNFSISKCKNRKCKTCAKLEIKSFFYYNITGKSYFIIHSSFKNIICHTSNIIYLLTFEDCGTQYVGKTANVIYTRMNLQRRGKKGCLHVTERFTSCC